ncbi:MAG: hypothetical protein WBC18_00565 [Ottowia sp.]|uniref:hypothetical protein n=1 Tax=Ottowia sp. TaxID=1898956 RepID=UPI003C78679E
MTPAKRSAQSLGRNVRPERVTPWMKTSLLDELLAIVGSGWEKAVPYERVDVLSLWLLHRTKLYLI